MRTRRVTTAPAIELDVIDAGEPGAPVIVLCHGWPESAHSWRHQIDPLVEAGWRVLVPNQRGYAHSSTPSEVEAYRSDHLSADLIALLDDVGAETATFVGHDWGALVVWDLARFHPDRVAGVVNVSVPYTPWPMQPTELFKAAYGDRFFYMLYFQEVGPVETELDADIAQTLRTIIWGGAGEMARPPRPPEELPPLLGTGLLETWADDMAIPEELPPWLPQADFDHFVEQFTASGFFGPISWYRNLDADWALTRDLEAPPMPCAFIGGSNDMVIAHRMDYVESMNTLLPDYRGTFMIDGPGHWTQQEAPAAFNTALGQALAALT
ncbi:MAG: alpha/beta fold hydrolase [Ilumatobacter sp.]